MADFDERALPSDPVDSIRTDDLRPWMVWTAAWAIAALAVLGLYFGVRGSHPAGITLTLTPGVAVNPAAAASAQPAQALPKDQQWSTLSGPEVLPKSAAPTKTSAAAESASGEEASAQPAAAAAAASEAASSAPPVAPAPPAASSAPPSALPPGPPDTAPTP